MDSFYKQNKNQIPMLEKFFNFIIKGKMRLHQLVGIDSAEIVVPFTNIEILSL